MTANETGFDFRDPDAFGFPASPGAMVADRRAGAADNSCGCGERGGGHNGSCGCANNPDGGELLLSGSGDGSLWAKGSPGGLDHPQFGKSIWNVLRTREEVFEVTEEGEGIGGPSRLLGAGTHDHGGFVGQGEATVSFREDDDRGRGSGAFKWSVWAEGWKRGRALVPEWARESGRIDPELNVLLSTDAIIEDAEREGPWEQTTRRRCEDLKNMMETALCHAMKARCPVEEGRLWVGGWVQSIRYRCGCTNPWRLLEFKSVRGWPQGVLGQDPTYVQVPGDVIKKAPTKFCAVECPSGERA
jgi:hypothetical protein